MKRRNGNPQRFGVCIDNSDYPASLELHKIYTVVPDERAAEDNFLRIVDESGEDYLYSEKRFVSVELPERVKQSVIRKVRETTKLAAPPPQPSRAKSKSKPNRVPRAIRS